jgi:hypothetical protein
MKAQRGSAITGRMTGHNLLSKPYRKVDLARRIHQTLAS